MILLQIILPALLVFTVFIVGHFFISSKGSGIYITELNFDNETVLEEPEEEVDPINIDPVSYTHLRAPRDKRQSRMPSSA